MKEYEVGACPWLATLWRKRGVLEFWDGTRKMTSNSITFMDLHKPNNKLVNA